MNTREVLGITPYVEGFEYGINESIFMSELYAKVIDKYQLEAKKFYGHIQRPKTEVHHKLIIVYGYSGCGKSTLVGRLIYELKQEGNVTFKLDLAKATSGDYYFFGKRTSNKYGDKTIGKLLALLKKEISQRLSPYINDYEEEELADYKLRLEKYQKFFEKSRDRSLQKFSRELNKLLSSDSLNKEEIYQFLEQEINKIIANENDDEQKYLIDSCKNAFCFLFLLLRSEWKDKNTDKKFFFVIDSLEHFIGRDQIFDKDIEDIINNILIPIVEQEENLDRERFPGEMTFNDIFKIIVSCRNSTLSMVSNNLDDDDYQDFYTVDVSNWYSAENIVNKRINYFKNQLDDPEIITLINKILGGDDNILKERLLKMHNHNMRRLFDYLCDILVEYNFIKKSYDTLSNYIENNKLIIDSVKNGRRSLIQGWLLYKIKSTGFFARMKALKDNKDEPLGHYLSRKTLTYLEYKANNFLDDYVGFYELLNCGLSNGGNITDRKYNDIVDILKALSEADKNENHWCQLIMIKFNNHEFSKELLKEKLIRAKDDERNKYAIKITSTGKYCLNLMSSFEYFSVRYNEMYRPLFDLRWLENNNIDNIIKLIENTKKCAFDCIDKVIHNDGDFFKTADATINYNLMYEMNGQLRSTEDGHLITHIESIIDNHISYLDAYRRFIIEYRMDANLKEKLLGKLLDVLEAYSIKNEDIYDIKSPDGESRYVRYAETRRCYYLPNCKKARIDKYNVNVKILKNQEV